MKIKRSIYLIGFLCLSLSTYAQKKEFKFGKVTPEDFNAKPFGQDSAAAAVKIFDVGDCYFEYNDRNGFEFVFEQHVRYKIINKNAYDLADFQIALYRGSNSAKEDVSRMEAATYNMEDDKLVITKLGKDAKFTENFNKNYQIKKYTLANIKEGSVIEYKYTIRSPFTFNLRGWSFQSGIPTLYTEYNVKIPEYLFYKPSFIGYYRPTQTKRETINAHYVTGVNSSAVYSQYVAENVPAMKDEPFITTMDDYISSIEFELMATRYPNDIYRDFNGTWPKIVKDLAEDENFGLFVKRNAVAKSLLPTIIKTETDTLKIANLIYNYVKTNTKWNDSYRRYTSETNPKTILEKKTGSSADINLLLLIFLKEAKIDANPVLISTRNNGAHPGNPIISKFNSVLVSAKIGGKDIIMDATNNDHFLGMVSYQSLNHQGFSIDLKSQTGTWIALEPSFNDEKIYNYSLTLDKENKLKGTMLQYYKGYGALSLRNRYRSNASETEFIKNLKKDKQGLEIDSYKINNLNNFEELLNEELTVTIEDNVEEAGNLVYLNPLLYERTKENFLKHEARTFPVDFGYPKKESIRATINFPEDYEIDKLPKGGVFKLPENKGSFTISFLSQEKTVLVRSVIEINKSVFSPEEYFDIKELFKVIVEKQAEQIVFKKKS
ncbi:transglutaminase domain-containing protein [Pedobacter xixiisoli]|uniref:Transglutaminase-like superfamily protein n=1 Tax=Pedobacter xixiisoli TaxID=1476464 RepID=A0A285ZP17_9SPHI|nr:transglutaminase domain-containing protein [Pedobacter xixiisoli]SOD11360.1 Transglutaminase-like superfamily protein [Pedobacter xixiisoli]